MRLLVELSCVLVIFALTNNFWLAFAYLVVYTFGGVLIKFIFRAIRHLRGGMAFVKNRLELVVFSIPAGIIDFLIFWYLLEKEISIPIVIVLTIGVILLSVTMVQEAAEGIFGLNDNDKEDDDE